MPLVEGPPRPGGPAPAPPPPRPWELRPPRPTPPSQPLPAQSDPGCSSALWGRALRRAEQPGHWVLRAAPLPRQAVARVLEGAGLGCTCARGAATSSGRATSLRDWVGWRAVPPSPAAGAPLGREKPQVSNLKTRTRRAGASGERWRCARACLGARTLDKVRAAPHLPLVGPRMGIPPGSPVICREVNVVGKTSVVNSFRSQGMKHSISPWVRPGFWSSSAVAARCDNSGTT